MITDQLCEWYRVVVYSLKYYVLYIEKPFPGCSSFNITLKIPAFTVLNTGLLDLKIPLCIARSDQWETGILCRPCCKPVLLIVSLVQSPNPCFRDVLKFTSFVTVSTTLFTCKLDKCIALTNISPIFVVWYTNDLFVFLSTYVQYLKNLHWQTT